MWQDSQIFYKLLDSMLWKVFFHFSLNSVVYKYSKDLQSLSTEDSITS